MDALHLGSGCYTLRDAGHRGPHAASAGGASSTQKKANTTVRALGCREGASSGAGGGCSAASIWNSLMKSKPPSPPRSSLHAAWRLGGEALGCPVGRQRDGHLAGSGCAHHSLTCRACCSCWLLAYASGTAPASSARSCPSAASSYHSVSKLSSVRASPMRSRKLRTKSSTTCAYHERACRSTLVWKHLAFQPGHRQ